jgi:hypothetical protein
MPEQTDKDMPRLKITICRNSHGALERFARVETHEFSIHFTPSDLNLK